MQIDQAQIRSELLAVIAEVEQLNLKKFHGIPAERSSIDEIIDGMIGNAKIHLGGASIENVFATWGSAHDAVEVYADPKTNPEARRPSIAEIELLDRYIADAKAITINSTNKSARVIATDGGLILQLGNYAHDHSCSVAAADDWNEFIKTRSTDGWDGHDSSAADVIVDERDRSHGIREFSEEEVDAFVRNGPPEEGPINFRLFIEELREIKSEEAFQCHNTAAREENVN